MTPTQREAALRLADELQRFDGAERESLRDEAAALLRELAAEPQGEPVAWMVTNVDGQDAYVTADPTLANSAQRALPLYTAPVQDTRACTCHPDDNPPTPCPRKYALGECREAAKAAPVQEPVAWIQPDHLQKARVAPFLCRVEPTKRMSDFVPLYAAPQQRHPLPEAAGFDHALGAGRFTVVKGAFWWHIRIGDSTNNVGKFHSKMAAENMALTLLTAFRDGAYTQYMISLSQQRKPLTDEQIDRLDTQAIHGGPDSQYAFRFARAIERAHGITGEPT